MKRFLSRTTTTIAMGNSYSHTMSVRTSCKKTVGRCCSFKSHPKEKCQHWNIHRGKLLTGHENIESVVKVSTASVPGSTLKAEMEVDAEVQKCDFAERVLRRCQGRGEARCVSFVHMYRSSIDKVGKMGQSARRQRTGSLSEGEGVLVQEDVASDIQCLLDVRWAGVAVPPSPALLVVAEESYVMSGGSRVIAGMKGVQVAADDDGTTSYRVTSVTVHSTGKEFGSTDGGRKGVRAYEEWRRLWMPPSTPLPPSAPPTYLEPTSPPPYLEPTASPAIVTGDFSQDQPDNRRWPSDSSAQSKFHVYPVADAGLSLGLTPSSGSAFQLFSRFSENTLNVLRDLPPAYSFTGAA